jgi:anti-anti-sigma factor
MVTAPPSAELLELHPVGAVRASDGEWFAQALADAITSGASNLEVDLRDVEFMDGSGVRVLAATAERLCASGGRLILRGPPYVVEVALAELAPPGSVTIYRA